MIANHETVLCMRGQAEAFAEDRARDLFGIASATEAIREAIRHELRCAFMQGADAGYTAAKAEERKP